MTAQTWTPEQFFEYLEGFVGEFECRQIKDTMQERGLVIVPIEPTRGMLDAAYVSATLHGDAPKGLLSPRNKMRRRYRAMIAAVPTPEQQQP